MDERSAAGEAEAGLSEPTRSASDEQLIAYASGTDGHVALSELLERHSRMVFSLGLRLLRDRERSEELVQESFTRLWRTAGEFDRSRGSVKTLLMTIARRAAIDMHRRAGARPELVAIDEVPAPQAPGDEFERTLRQLEMRDAMEQLSDKHRTVIEMQFDRDLTQAEIAEALEIPLGTVKSRSRNALRALREMVERPLDE